MKTFPHMTSYWAMQHMPYQEYLVRHIIMMTAVLWLGSQTLGFELAGYSDMQNFLLNFAWYVFFSHSDFLLSDDSSLGNRPIFS